MSKTYEFLKECGSFFARECYIDGCWNKENENDYLTEIEFPVKKK